MCLFTPPNTRIRQVISGVLSEMSCNEQGDWHLGVKCFVFAWIWQSELLFCVFIDVFFVFCFFLTYDLCHFEITELKKWHLFMFLVVFLLLFFFFSCQKPVSRNWNNDDLKKSLNAVVKYIIIPSFIKIQSAESGICKWHIWQIEV